ncbi:hypothetical protein BGZ96_010675 [Linnemannia gamsii]|uniref:Secreted protein n=1 Tax=Linnemannia gamsii TaxID=64522 RepID=A0ABQ7JUA0_9FUNG|nr:hypothetical protein BGZ96_010675 [Linnemannia gamsii]
MKIILALAAAVLSAPALVAGVCVDRSFGKHVNPKPSDCPVGYTIYQNKGCSGASFHLNDGGFRTGEDNWNVQSYECDDVNDPTYRCHNHHYGFGTFPKPSLCKAGVTIYQKSNCTGDMVELQGGWTSGPGDWPVESYRCK